MGHMLAHIRPTLRIVAALGMLLIVILSIHFPPISPGEVLARRLNLNKARDFTCMDAAIPRESDVLFAADPSTPNLLAQYYRSQSFLSPRLIIMPDPSTLEDDMARYDWIIETSLTAEPFPQLNQHFQLAVIKDCDDFYVLHKAPQP